MKIPIANALYNNKINISSLIKKEGNFLKNLQHLKFSKVDKKRFPIVTLLTKKVYQNSGPIILNASNEVLVENFINNKISFNAIYQYLRVLFRDRDFNKYAIKKSPNTKEIYRIDKWARMKTIEVIKKGL